MQSDEKMEQVHSILTANSSEKTMSQIKPPGEIPNCNKDLVVKIIQVEHNYALNMKLKAKREYNCSVCGYVTSVFCRFTRHRAENCDIQPYKSEPCPICGKVFTHNGLRDHLRNYTAPNRAFRGEHKNYSTEHHSKLLQKISKK